MHCLRNTQKLSRCSVKSWLKVHFSLAQFGHSHAERVVGKAVNKASDKCSASNFGLVPELWVPGIWYYLASKLMIWKK